MYSKNVDAECSLLQPREPGYYSLLNLFPLICTHCFIFLSCPPPQNKAPNAFPLLTLPLSFSFTSFCVLFIFTASLGIYHFSVTTTEWLSSPCRHPWCLQWANQKCIYMFISKHSMYFPFVNTDKAPPVLPLITRCTVAATSSFRCKERESDVLSPTTFSQESPSTVYLKEELSRYTMRPR